MRCCVLALGLRLPRPERQFVARCSHRGTPPNGRYSEAVGWSHLGLARHARDRAFTAQLLRIPRPDDLWAAVTAPGILIISIGTSFESESSAGHLAVVAGFPDSGAIAVHRPSSQNANEGRNFQMDPDTFWTHFPGRGIHIGHKQFP